MTKLELLHLLEEIENPSTPISQREVLLQLFQENVNDPDFISKYFSYYYEGLTLLGVVEEVLSFTPPQLNLSHNDLLLIIEKILHRNLNDREYGKLIDTLCANISDPNITDYFNIDNITAEEILSKSLQYKPIILSPSSE